MRDAGEMGERRERNERRRAQKREGRGGKEERKGRERGREMKYSTFLPGDKTDKRRIRFFIDCI